MGRRFGRGEDGESVFKPGMQAAPPSAMVLDRFVESSIRGGFGFSADDEMNRLRLASETVYSQRGWGGVF